MTIERMTNLDLTGKRVLIREDLNVPMHGTDITDESRIQAALPTIKLALEKGAAVMIVSHLGRPTEGEINPDLSLAPVAAALTQDLGQDVTLVKDWLDGVEVKPGQVVLLENVRFQLGEKKNDEALAKKMSALCDVFVMDAFATSHRSQASTEGVARFAPVACAGPLLEKELDALGKALENPERPLLAIVGGAKVSTKIHVLRALLDKVNSLIVGGGIANTFLVAKGIDVGRSLFEPDWVQEAKDVLKLAEQKGITLPLPVDVVVAKNFAAEAEAVTKSIEDINSDEMILDIGPETIKHYEQVVLAAKTIVWNGPVGVFEFDQFANGTKSLAEAIAAHSAFSIAGGGDTIAALVKYQLTEKMSYISTGGGAFLEFLEGKTLPAVAALDK